MKVLATVPAKDVTIADVVTCIEKKGAYKFITIEKAYTNDVNVIDALIEEYDIKVVQVKS